VPELRVYEASVKPVEFRSPTAGDVRVLRLLLEGSWAGQPLDEREQLALLIRAQLGTDIGDVLVWQAHELQRRR
jgi:hypothetical protein